jgi:hypothetical protein
MLSNKRQSEVVQRKNMKIFNVLKTILDLRMKNGAAAAGTKYSYGVSMYLWSFNRGMPHKNPVLSA